MTRIVITGGHGFLGRNLVSSLREREGCSVTVVGREDSAEDMERALRSADTIFHLAGVNRPADPGEFDVNNTGLTKTICQILSDHGRSPKIIFSSSSQAAHANPYGVSKARSEEILLKFSMATGSTVRLYRLTHLFGKWCRPNYNSVTATFCYNIARELPIVISDPMHEIELTYVDDVVSAFLEELDGYKGNPQPPAKIASRTICLKKLADTIRSFHSMRTTLMVPDLADRFHRALYATYLSYVPDSGRKEALMIKEDHRGSLAEFMKQEHFGQIFVSRTKPGVTRGNHYHNTKVEKFFVVEGEGLIRLRSIEGGPIEEHIVRGGGHQVINIPPGMTHSIKNIGAGEMITLFWASEIFDPNSPDTHVLPVDFDEHES